MHVDATFENDTEEIRQNAHTAYTLTVPRAPHTASITIAIPTSFPVVICVSILLLLLYTAFSLVHVVYTNI